MKKLWTIVAFCAFAALTLFGQAFVASASAESSSLPPGFLVGDDSGFQAGTDGKYFISNYNIVPGRSFSRVITISNYSTEDGSFAINLVMNPDDEAHVPEKSGVIDLLEAISVTLTYQGKVIYEGPISGDGTPVANQKSDPIFLDSLEIGEVRNIQADFTVSDEYPYEDWKDGNSVDFYWLFFASRETTTPTTPTTTTTTTTPTTGGSTATSSSLPSTGGKLPKTGEDWRNVLIGMIAGFVLITVALIIAKKRHGNQRD